MIQEATLPSQAASLAPQMLVLRANCPCRWAAGVASELTMVWLALPTIKSQRLLYLDLPNRLNFGFDYHLICWLVVAAYVPGEPGRAG